MTHHESSAGLPEPPVWSYAAAALIFVGAVAAVAKVSDRLLACVAAGAVCLLLAGLSGWLYRRKGYAAAEGFFGGLLAWPLTVAFGIWGPAADRGSS